MRYITVKGYDGSDMQVSRIAMGSAMSMAALPSNEVERIFDTYLSLGGNCLDTARAYGDGACEEMVGAYLKRTGKRREVLISTKGCHPKGGDDGPSRLSWADLEEDIQASLRVLGTDCIDIYWIHKDDESLPVEPIIDNINRLIKAGWVRAVGCSNWHLDRIQKANAYAKESGQHGFFGSQIQWSFTDTKEEYFKEHHSVVMDEASYHWYLEQAMPVFAFSSQAQGFCARVEAGGLDSIPEFLRMCYASPENMIRYERAHQYALAHQVPISAPVVAHITHNRLPGVAIIGALTPDMLKLSMQGAELDLTPEEVDAMFVVNEK